MGPTIWISKWREEYCHKLDPNQIERKELDGLTNQMEQQDSSRDEIKKNFKMFLIPNLVMIFISLLCLNLYYLVIKYESGKWAIFVLTGLLVFYCLIRTYLLSSSLLGTMKK